LLSLRFYLHHLQAVQPRNRVREFRVTARSLLPNRWAGDAKEVETLSARMAARMAAPLRARLDVGYL